MLLSIYFTFPTANSGVDTILFHHIAFCCFLFCFVKSGYMENLQLRLIRFLQVCWFKCIFSSIAVRSSRISDIFEHDGIRGWSVDMN
jgi:hypothetical protein